MFRRTVLPTLAALLVLAACAESPIGTASAVEEDFALTMFGAEGAALEGTLGPQTGPRPFDGRTHRPHFPDSLALTDEQKAEMLALREAFRTEHAASLDSLRAIFEEARAARDSGATREEVRAILVTGRPIAEALRPHVRALHLALRAVLTDAQRAWIAAHRPPRHHGPIP